MDCVRARQKLNSLFECFWINGLQQAFEGSAPGLGKLRKKGGGATRCGFSQMLQPSRVIRPATRIGIPEQLLHFGKAGEAHDLAEPHEGGTLHACPFGHLCDSRHGDTILIGGNEIGALLEPLWQAVGHLQQLRFEFLDICRNADR